MFTSTLVTMLNQLKLSFLKYQFFHEAVLLSLKEKNHPLDGAVTTDPLFPSENGILTHPSDEQESSEWW